MKYSKQLVDAITRESGRPLDASKWFNYYSFDVMGDLAFGKSFKMLTTGKEHFFLQLLHQGQSAAGVFTPIPWATVLLKQVPFALRTLHKFLAWCGRQVEERQKVRCVRLIDQVYAEVQQMEMAEPDVMSYIIDSANHAQNPKEARNWLQADSRLIIVAGRSVRHDKCIRNILMLTCQLPATPPPRH